MREVSFTGVERDHILWEADEHRADICCTFCSGNASLTTQSRYQRCFALLLKQMGVSPSASRQLRVAMWC